MNEVRVSTTFGLANRMLALASGMQVAEEAGAQLRLHWGIRKDCGCPFGRLFVNEVPRVPLTEVRNADQFFNLISRPRPATNEIQFGPVNSIGVAVCTTWWRAGFPPVNDQYLQRLEPHPAIIQRVEETWRKLEGNRDIVGFHIRGTDHRVARQVSTVPKFLEVAESLIRTRPGVRFLVCSDREEPKKTFQTRYSWRVVLPGKRTYNRRSPVAVEEALVDLLLLGRTTGVWGSKGSTFSRAAALRGGVPLVVVE